MKYKVQELPKWLTLSLLVVGYFSLFLMGTIFVISMSESNVLIIVIFGFLTFVSLYIIRMGYVEGIKYYETKYVYRDSVRFLPTIAMFDVKLLDTGEYVYLLQDVSVTGYCKIGYTNNPARRLYEFDTKLPMKIVVIHIIKCSNMERLEKALHMYFREKRINGEWFDLNHDDVAEIKAIDSSQW